LICRFKLIDNLRRSQAGCSKRATTSAVSPAVIAFVAIWRGGPRHIFFVAGLPPLGGCRTRFQPQYLRCAMRSGGLFSSGPIGGAHWWLRSCERRS